MSRDPRRFFSESDRTAVFTRQEGKCHCCHEQLDSNFHMHHVIPWGQGGPTVRDNALGVCPSCHIEAPTASLQGVTLRLWQEEAMQSVLPILRSGGFATTIAAPGAGKTLFAMALASHLAASGHIDRVLVVVPNTHLRESWATAGSRFGIQLDENPRYGVERRGFDGFVITYAAFSNPDTVQACQQSVDDGRTLIVLDEAHHLAADEDGDHRPWAHAIRRIAGSIDAPRTPTLNLTGTPFRSDTSQRISTFRYRAVNGQPDKIECTGDYEVPASTLIDEGHLRHIDLLSFNAGLQAVDLTTDTEHEILVSDLSDQGRRIRSEGLRSLIRDVDHYIAPQIDELLSKLRVHQEILGSPVKGLIVADDSRHANQIYEVLESRIGRHAMVAHSKTDDPRGDLRRFRSSSNSAVLVSVRMVTEGFDCPEITSIVHATNWSAPLFINQLVARAMRVTDAERRLGLVLPATIMVPADPELVRVYSDVLVSSVRVLDARAVCPTCNSLPCGCTPGRGDRQCGRCAFPWRLCVCLCAQCGMRRRGCGCPRPRVATVDVQVTSEVELHGVSHDGQGISMTLVRGIDWAQAGVPEPFIPAAVAAVQAHLSTAPYEFAEVLRQHNTGANP